MRTLKSTYNEIFRFLENYKSEIVFDIQKLKWIAEEHLFYNRLKNDYDFNVNMGRCLKGGVFNDSFVELKYGVYYLKVNEYNMSGSFDDGIYPEHNEELVKVDILGCIPNISFIKDTFLCSAITNSFFAFLKTYDPKYMDTVNKILYFTLENGAKVYNEYDAFIDDWYKKTKGAENNAKINELESQIDKLKNN